MLSSILYGLAHVANIVFNLVTVLVIISVGISWFNVDPYNPFVAGIRSLTEPLYRPFRAIASKVPGPFDFAPMIVLLVVVFLQKSVPTYLMMLSNQMK